MSVFKSRGVPIKLFGRDVAVKSRRLTVILELSLSVRTSREFTVKMSKSLTFLTKLARSVSEILAPVTKYLLSDNERMISSLFPNSILTT